MTPTGFSAHRLGRTSRQVKEIETSVSITSAAVAISQEYFFLSEGRPLSEVGWIVDERVNKLQSKSGLSVENVKKNVQSGRTLMAGTATDSAIRAFFSYNQAAFDLNQALRPAFARLASVGFSSQMGLACIVENVVPFFHHYGLLIPAILDEWEVPEYALFAGSQYYPAIYADCSSFMSGLDEATLKQLAETGPKLAAQPTLTLPADISEATDALLESFQTLAGQIESQGSTAVKFLKDRRKNLVAVVAMASVCVAVILFFLVTMPLCISPSTKLTREDVYKEYNLIESKTKIVVQYLPFIAALKEDARLHLYLKDCFLSKIEGFMARVRPYITQTCFGDIEAILFANNGEISQLRGEEGGGNSTEDEQRSQELRTDVGLQVAFGTFMCVSAGSHLPLAENLSGDQQLAALHERMKQLIAAIEYAADRTRGVVHVIAGDYIYVTWNVVSTCLSGEVNAFHTAVQLTQEFESAFNGVSISIARSPVIAGNIESGGRMSSILCGPGVARCEALEGLNAYNGTSLMIDEGVAAKVNAVSGDYCVVPTALYRWRDYTESGYDVAYTVYPLRIQDRHRQWISIFRQFPELLSTGRAKEMLSMVDKYKSTYMVAKSSARGNQMPENAQTVDFWILLLNKYINSTDQSE